MDRVQYIKNLSHITDLWERGALIPALAACLTPAEACEALDVTFDQPADIRKALLHRIAGDIKNRFLECHSELVGRLIRVFEALPSKKKQTAGYCLKSLSEYLPKEFKDTVIQLLLSSKYIVIRRLAYKILQRPWADHNSPWVEHAWQRHKEVECAVLIIEHFPIAFIEKEIKTLEQIVAGTWDMRKLFLHLCQSNKDYLQRLKKLDEISYVYVATKVGIILPISQAESIFEKNKHHEERGLLIWCYGRQGLWPLLERIASNSPRLIDEDLATLS